MAIRTGTRWSSDLTSRGDRARQSRYLGDHNPEGRVTAVELRGRLICRTVDEASAQQALETWPLAWVPQVRLELDLAEDRAAEQIAAITPLNAA